MPAKYGQRIEPHGEVVKILAVAIRGFTDTDAATATKDAIDFSGDPSQAPA